jgi:predicted ATP-grasp superfamily ATP-dependent carboligase
VKILIFEYITGGGFCSADLPASLTREGGLMLNALLDDFASLPEHDIIVMLDERCLAKFARENFNVIPVKATDNVFTVFQQAIKLCDAVWIIAPETYYILFNLTRCVERENKILLSNPSDLIVKTSKLLISYLLTSDRILTPISKRLSDCEFLRYTNLYKLRKLIVFPQIIKPITGAGCENTFLIQDEVEFHNTIKQIEEPQNYLIQPFITGDNLSLSALFNQGTAELICVNRQHLKIRNQQLKLMACEVNIEVENKTRFKQLLNKIAKAFPGLFGYVGIDLIVSDLIYVVEINPRLTSSYAGINQALGINVADLVLQSMNGEAVINPLRNQTILIEIAQEQSNGV